jgi:hypothetical protein
MLHTRLDVAEGNVDRELYGESDGLGNKTKLIIDEINRIGFQIDGFH